ncbi:MAG: glycerol-3-phosphate dehydrogenase/oxidase [Bellilinea sp.]
MQEQQRDGIWDQIAGPWDLIIIGGGIVGAGLLREASQARLRALLIEGNDFASGTSSRSSKMVHGGLRYLSTGQIKLTMESVHERQRLLHEGRGLIDPLEFLLVSYKGDRPPAWIFAVGLMVYDTLAMKWQHQHESADELEMLCPQLPRDKLAGGFRFFDAQTDDARMVLRVLQEGIRAGGTAVNYVRAEGLLRERSGKVCGAQLRDQVTGRTAEVRAQVVVNATGAWADELRGQVGRPPRLRQLCGSHLIFPRHKLPVNKVISFLHPVDRRPVFAFPWEGVTLVGTTDVDFPGPMETNPRISGGEVDYLMEAVTATFGCLNLNTSDVQSTLAGIRSVLDTGKANPSKEARDEVLWNEDGLVTITGGKLTMFRRMAQKTLHFIRPSLPSHIRLERHTRALDAIQSWDCPAMADQLGLDPTLQLRLLGRYGHAAGDLLCAAGTDELTPIRSTPTLWAELRWAARAEQVVHLEDLLLRRTRLGLLLPAGGLAEFDRIRAVCQPELGWSDQRWQAEASNYLALWQRSYNPPGVENSPFLAGIPVNCPTLEAR